MVATAEGRGVFAKRPGGGRAVGASLSERPPKWCTVPLSEIRERGLRLEAAVYDVESRSARKSIMNGAFGWKPLAGKGGFANAYVRGRFKRIWVEFSGTPIYQPSAVPELDPEPDGFLSAKTPVDFDSLRVHLGQVLVTCSGTIGKAALVSQTLDGKVFSHDLLRITCHDPVDSGYVYAFLKSRAGQRLLAGNQYGAVITHIEPDHLASLPVPDAPVEIKRRIHERVSQSYEKRDESNNLLHQAASLLQDALGLPPLRDFPEQAAPNATIPKTFAVPLSRLSGRLDGSYHLPVVDSIRARLIDTGDEVTTIGDTRVSKEIILPARFKRVYVEEGFGKIFIGGKQLGELDPSNKKYLSTVHHGARIAQQLTLRENMTLVTCSGTIGRTALVGRHWDGWTASQHIMRIVPASIDIAGYLYVWLSSEWAKPLIVRNSYGAVIDEIDDVQLSAVPVPLLRDAATQTEINQLSLTASALRSEAYDLEQSALRDMEVNVLGTP